MNIGQAASASGVSTKMIRYYEQSGLIPRADRTAAGYRDYSDRDVHELRFIRRARDLGFSIAEIADLLGLWRDRSRRSADVKLLAENHIEALESKIREMQEMANTLRDLANSCHGDHRSDCPIIERLERPSAEDGAPIVPRAGAVRRNRK